MTRPPPLTDIQKSRLARLEPALRHAVNRGNYPLAKQITADIQDLLRPTGHETRLMQSKNWLFEAAMEAGELNLAKQGLIGVRTKVARTTRTYLEATALLAICFIRQRDLVHAGPLMQEVLTNDTYIKSPKTRREFRRHIIQRFDEEGALVALIGYGHESMIAEEIHDDAARLVQTSGEDEIFARVGDALPKEVVSFLQQVDELARNVIPPGEMRYLPPPRHLIERGALGRTVVGSVRSVAWRALCDPNSDIYQMWVREGIGAVVNKTYVAAALTAAIAGLGIGLKALVVSMLALVMKFGIEVFCDRFSPQPVMQIRRRR